MAKKVTLWHWPESQICIGCPNGCFVMGNEDESDGDDRIGDSAYLCFSNKEVQDDNCRNTHVKEE